ncbi:MAG: protein-(glutamine-N5) methyltransferase, release factor-specific [Hydrogenophilales bacterium 16-64-46]|nr:MAG: protein-(glutamine-N5) methyltransferase, release factor-specific [Hydrogenophilales bacterium 16-64-46]OZA39713.1 MAG: protein-(glutamine-N5) methyltransferase, release factor-specific [Hydrogenophilales bacterium 17-64-34]HQS98751.1 peptide chain release factor N(5)-glutamine methyltransferase [Thiobacillus sp.]
MASVSALLDATTARLAAALGLDTRDARLDARVLAAHAWGVSHAWLIAHDRDLVDPAAQTDFQSLVERRAAGEPVAYVVGVREFYGRLFHVTPDVLIPRPDSELLVERALACLPPDRPADVLDLGTGSGCLAITLALERPLARVVAVDRSAPALAVARRNADTHRAPVEYMQSNWFEALGGQYFDIIVSNPPYIAADDSHLGRGDVRFEPREALVAGQQGLADLAKLIHQASCHLKPDAWLMLEHGHEQENITQALFRKQDYQQVRTWRDLAGHPRVTTGLASK